VEIFENNAPMLINRRELVPNSGGPGEYRGGLGQRLVFTAQGDRPLYFFVRPDKLRFPAPGILGGLPGRPGKVLLNGRPAPMTAMTLAPGDSIELQLPGGGGVGPPSAREATAVARDVAEGYERCNNARRRETFVRRDGYGARDFLKELGVEAIGAGTYRS
jgi:N-methylhydantoinase B